MTNAQSGMRSTASLDAGASHQSELATLRAALEEVSTNTFNATVTAQLARISSDAVSYAERESNARDSAMASFFAADSLDRQMRYAEAMAQYSRSLHRDPSGPYAGRALARVSSLQQDELEDFAALRLLETFRRAHSSTPATVVEAQGLVSALRTLRACSAKQQGLMLAASALHEAGAKEPAVRVLRGVVEDPLSTLDQRALAMHQLAMMREETQDFLQARAELVRLHADPREIARMGRLGRRKVLRVVLRWVVGVQLALGLLAVLLSARRDRGVVLLREWRRPLPWMHLAVLTFGGAVLTRSYDNHEIGHVWGLGAGASLVYLAATAMSVCLANFRYFRRSLRVIAVVLSFSAVLGVSFLAMDRYDNGMLDGISL